MATGHRDGTATIVAALGNKSAQIVLVVRAPNIALRGTVTESAPTEDVPVAGARIEVVGGRAAGAFAISDAAGHFVLQNVPSTVTLRAAHGEYEPGELVDTDGSSPPRLSLMPTPRMVSVSVVGSRQSPSFRTASASFAMHRSGTVHLLGEINLVDAGSSTSCMEIRSGQEVVWSRSFKWSFVQVREAVALPGGRRYDLQVFPCPGVLSSAYILLLHPV